MEGPTVGIISWIALFLGTAWFCKARLNWTISSKIELLSREFKHLAKVKPTPLGLNALGISIYGFLAFLLFFHSGARDVFHAATKADQISAGNDQHWLFVVMLGMLMFGLLMCLDICRKYRD